ncbi:heavy-metal-associated domain-containing protein [Corynebacterium pseudodiphtheriticum]|uniref:heavy-metal-associated domain-containing protein n=1 Tax=Corynebacterium pseudodiphtheriticum TaxID=37637 RepID=UPI0020BF8236|nr:cation transporter [Corynebacterium pseudodiphtheriticum]MDK8552751.1 cation transporter [Corynebacterium pseudodiphtheriticum]MDK8564224.1 cation transporter [Corynebacterium pseudodiphtheriticum]MDK8614299.1 cation transporter [Corynebacterium pseudodiphtheriticum]MDK8699761.1 cation transporter [Corynebacterium pseudodiphtheriticum]MDK8718442.1 cation transporter [Corynebacterium pseudodiphtheriticum]
MSNPSTTFRVTGMTCAHCENAVHEEVSQVPGVAGLTVSAEEGTLTVFYNNATDNNAGNNSAEAENQASDEDIIAAVNEAGYTAERA